MRARVCVRVRIIVYIINITIQRESNCDLMDKAGKFHKKTSFLEKNKKNT